MSRNLCEGNTCRRCGGDVYRTGEWRSGKDFVQISRMPYREYDSVMFCHARCCECGTPYLGWGHLLEQQGSFDGSIIDLSYRNSFNDEPTTGDEPVTKARTDDEKRSDAWCFEKMKEGEG